MTTGPRTASASAVADAVTWHDVECASYDADLPLWRRLAESAGGVVLELGAGTGRVTLHLAQCGKRVAALDSDPELVRELSRRARHRGVDVGAYVGDARSFSLERQFGLVVAPMQVVQLLGGRDARAAMLASVRRHLEPGGALALALADPVEGLPEGDVLPPLPDVREVDGWIYSSRPVAVREEPGAVAIDRVRESVSPRGEHGESMATIVLDRLGADELAAEAVAAGWRERERERVPDTAAYVGSDVVVLEPAA